MKPTTKVAHFIGQMMNSVKKALKDLKALTPTMEPPTGLILSSPAVRILREGAWHPL